MPTQHIMNDSVEKPLILDQSALIGSIAKLQNYIRLQQYRGYDPYDGLISPLFKFPVLRSNNFIRFGSQQVLRRIPLNWRPALGVRKGLNPVTLGLCIQAYTHLSELQKEKSELHLDEISYCIDRLQELRSEGYSGACWGYDFDWQGRYANISAYTPTVVATGMIENGLYEYYGLHKDERAKELILSSAEFVLKDLNRSYENDTFCFSYSPNDRQVVFNATMKAARTLSHAYTLSGDSRFIEEAGATAKFVVNHQNHDGSWPYSFGDARTWVDNFHSGYVLDCLEAYRLVTGDARVQSSIDSGFSFYRNNFFTPDGMPKYYSKQIYPIDSTAAAQSILTLCNFGELEKANMVAMWMIENMQEGSGYFYYQKHKVWTNKVPYMRWSNACMFAALSSLLLSLNENSLD